MPSTRYRLADLYPPLVRGLPPVAREQLTAPIVTLDRGPCPPGPSLEDHLGVLIVSGLLTREVVIGQTVATELVGAGDVLRPADNDGAGAPMPFDIQWTALEPATVALLDRHFTITVGRYPEALEVLMSGAVRRAQSLSVHLAVSHMRRVDTRLLALLWHMADRWGKVGTDGVHVPLKLTHRSLGRIVGAQRPSVTVALSQLAAEGFVSRVEDGSWMLHGPAPEALEQIRVAS
jgi:CRP/FNR family transcriptional regulator, cyclic AMP receptor protein